MSIITTKIRLLPLMEAQTIAMKEEMQEAFLHGFQSYYKDDNQWQVLPDKDFYQSLVAEGAEAHEAVNNDGQRVGGAIIAIDAAKHRGELAFLYVKVGINNYYVIKLGNLEYFPYICGINIAITNEVERFFCF